jgi:hypothetical protein
LYRIFKNLCDLAKFKNEYLDSESEKFTVLATKEPAEEVFLW